MYKEIPKPRTKAQIRKDLMEITDVIDAKFEKEVEMIYKIEQLSYEELIKEQEEKFHENFNKQRK